jgi:hypothetical protein
LPSGFFSPSSFSLISSSISLMSCSSLSLTNSPLSFYCFFETIWSCIDFFYTLKLLVSTEPSTPVRVWKAYNPFLPFEPASLFPSSFMIGSILSAVRSINEIDSSRMLNGMSRTGEFSLINYF